MSGRAGAGASANRAVPYSRPRHRDRRHCLALASERPDCEVTAVDVMPDAVALALRNAEHLGIANVTISQSDWFSALAGQRFATIVSNPPISTPPTRISPKAMCALSR